VLRGWRLSERLNTRPQHFRRGHRGQIRLLIMQSAPFCSAHGPKNPTAAWLFQFGTNLATQFMMKTILLRLGKARLFGASGNLSSLVCAAVFTAWIPFAQADIPDRSPSALCGMYKIAASNDPIFPVTAKHEWFLDFGDGINSRQMSGKVAISLRQNPSVRVRIMAWQFFPEKGNLLIGNPFHEGSQQAVARGNWQLRMTPNGAIFERGIYQVTLHQAESSDY